MDQIMLKIGLFACGALVVGLAGCAEECSDPTSRAFLEEAAAEEGAIQTASGLVYKELVPGYGPRPEASDRVRVHYHGTFIDGTVFDSSVKRGRPSTFPLDRVIPGWTEGLQLLKGGGKARLVIPPHLAYGKKGKAPKIPPCATLVFEIELLTIF
jgi:FKBP-type peptidyl-prolyl cis-trans isomerase